MDIKQIIIILLVVIVALAAAIGFVLFNQATAKEQTIVKITSDIAAKVSWGKLDSLRN